MKFIGAMLLVACAFFIGDRLAKREKLCLEQVSACKKFLVWLETRIRLTDSDLPKLFSLYRDKTLSDCGFLPSLNGSGRNIPEIWGSALSLLSLPEQTQEELRLLGNELGRLPRAEQQKRFALCISSLEQTESELRARTPGKAKSIKTVCALIGLLAAIILI